MPNYTPEHGDVYILQDRPSLGFSANGQNNTVTPNPWYVAGETINKGTVVSIANIAYALAVTGNSADAGKVFETKPANAVQCVGIALNTATYGQGIEVQDHGLYTFSSNFFASSDLGNTVYVAPQPPDPVTNFAAQLTTNRNLASSSGTPLIEIGIALAANKLFIDFQGDTRGSVNLSQVSANSGEAIANNGVPLLVSIGTDGNAYLADRRKSANTAVITFQTLLGTATNITFGSISYTSPLASFTINSVSGATAGTIIIAGVTVTLTGGDIATPTTVASKIAATSFPLWSVTSSTNTVNMVQTSFPQNRNTPTGYVIGANSGFQASGVIPQGIPIVIQKAGITTGFTGLLPGQPLWLDINGAQTQNSGSLSYYTDVATPTGYAETSSSIYVGIGYSTQTADANPIGSIIAQPPAGVDYGYLACDGSYYDGTNVVYTPLWNIIGTTYGGSGQNNFRVPSMSFAGINFEIKYLNWYMYNPPIAPFFMYDTGWTQWGSLPNGVSIGTAGQYMEIPTTQFGYDPPATDIFGEIYVQNAGLTVIRQINPNPIYSGSTCYGFQISKDIANNIRIEFADGGLAFYSSGGFTAIDNTWTYRIMLYKTERFNKFYDYLADQKLQQLWTLGLVSLNASYTTPGPGFFDRSALSPSIGITTRLNYSGDFYATDIFTTNTMSVGGSLSVTGTTTHSASVTVGNFSVQTSGNVSTSGNISITGSGGLLVAGTASVSGTTSLGVLTTSGAVTFNNTFTMKTGGNTTLSVDTSGNLSTTGTLASTYNGVGTGLSVLGTSLFTGLSSFTNGFLAGAGSGTVGVATFNLPLAINQAITQYNLGIQTFAVDTSGNVTTTGNISTTLGANGNLSIYGTSTFRGLVTLQGSIDGPATLGMFASPTSITFGAGVSTFNIGNSTSGGTGTLNLYSSTTTLSGNTTVSSGALTLGSSSKDGRMNFYINGGAGNDAWISNVTAGHTLTLNQNNVSGNVIVQVNAATLATFNSSGVTLINTTVGANVGGVGNGALLYAAGGFVLENRNGSDPSNPSVGQMWVRTDL